MGKRNDRDLQRLVSFSRPLISIKMGRFRKRSSARVNGHPDWIRRAVESFLLDWIRIKMALSLPRKWLLLIGIIPWRRPTLTRMVVLVRRSFFKHPPFAKIPVERMGKMFERFDHNSDGFIDRKDGRHGGGRVGPRGERFPRVRLKNLDSDKSGALSWKEFQKSPTLKNLSKEERRQAFRRLDADKNDELSSKELKSPFERGSGKKPQRPAPKK